jgi:hypothetical protein
MTREDAAKLAMRMDMSIDLLSRPVPLPPGPTPGILKGFCKGVGGVGCGCLEGL